jgi:hypothetical protein
MKLGHFDKRKKWLNFAQQVQAPLDQSNFHCSKKFIMGNDQGGMGYNNRNWRSH